MPLSKRVLDVAVASLALLVLSPVMLFVAGIIWLLEGRPIFFLQDRPGLFGRPFRMIKFRTMNNDRDSSGQLLPDGSRLTVLGKFLRSSSLDELPELLNVLKGDMSLVGPRPLLMEYLPLYTTEQARRHDVRPGITGWAQVKGRNAISWQDKFSLDVWYVNNWSLCLDLKILALTIWQVVSRQGISYQSHETMPKFRGTNNQDSRQSTR